MSERSEFERDPRGYALNMAKNYAGGAFVMEMLRDALNWMSKDDCVEFCDANGYAPEEDDDEDDDEEEADE